LDILHGKSENIPAAIISCISRQLKVDAILFNQYRWKDSVWKAHLSSIREFTGFRPGNKNDSQKLADWLIDGARHHPTRSKMFFAAIHRCRHLRLELPREKELQRLVNSAWQQYLSIVCREISERLGPKPRKKMDQCLDFDPNDKERYGWMKANPRKIGMKTLFREIKRLQFVNDFGIKVEVHLVDVPDDVLKLLRERAAPEGTYQLGLNAVHVSSVHFLNHNLTTRVSLSKSVTFDLNVQVSPQPPSPEGVVLIPVMKGLVSKKKPLLLAEYVSMVSLYM